MRWNGQNGQTKQGVRLFGKAEYKTKNVKNANHIQFHEEEIVCDDYDNSKVCVTYPAKKKKYVLQPWNEKLMQTQLSSIQLAEPTDYVKHTITY